jgi:hypothetical protein
MSRRAAGSSCFRRSAFRRSAFAATDALRCIRITRSFKQIDENRSRSITRTPADSRYNSQKQLPGCGAARGNSKRNSGHGEKEKAFLETEDFVGIQFETNADFGFQAETKTDFGDEEETVLEAGADFDIVKKVTRKKVTRKKVTRKKVAREKTAPEKISRETVARETEAGCGVEKQAFLEEGADYGVDKKVSLRTEACCGVEKYSFVETEAGFTNVLFRIVVLIVLFRLVGLLGFIRHLVVEFVELCSFEFVEFA